MVMAVLEDIGKFLKKIVGSDKFGAVTDLFGTAVSIWCVVDYIIGYATGEPPPEPSNQDVLDAIDKLDLKIDELALDLRQQIDAAIAGVQKQALLGAVARAESVNDLLSSYDSSPNAVTRSELISEASLALRDTLAQALVVAQSQTLASDATPAEVELAFNQVGVAIGAVSLALSVRGLVASRLEADEIYASRIQTQFADAADFLSGATLFLRNTIKAEYSSSSGGSAGATLAGPASIIQQMLQGEPEDWIPVGKATGTPVIVRSTDYDSAIWHNINWGTQEALLYGPTYTLDPNATTQFLTNIRDPHNPVLKSRAEIHELIGIFFEIELEDGFLGAAGFGEGGSFLQELAELYRSQADGVEKVLLPRIGRDDSGILDGSAGNDLLVGGPGDDLLNGLGDNDILRGGDGKDTLNGGADNDRLFGDAGDDKLFGNAGDDGLIGGEGADLLDGGAGFDSAMFAGRRADYTITTSGLETLVSGPDGNDTLINVERLFFDDVTVNLINGNDTLDDHLTGDYSVDVIANKLLDTVVEELASDDIIHALGGDDTVEGLHGDDTLYGGDGDDTLRGDAGDDELIGGAGDDDLFGGAGYDVAVYSGNPADYLVTDLGGGVFEVSDQRAGSPDGTDRLEGIEDLKFASVVSDFVIGPAGANVDQFLGFAGNDTASYENATSGVIANLLNSKKNTGWAAGDTYNAIENLTGSDFNDKLTGDAFDNFLKGGEGDDTLDGGSGNDTLEGGAGADRLIGGLGNDTASYANAGPQGVTANLLNPARNDGEARKDTYSGIENLRGSAYTDELAGNNAANILEGNDGDDRLIGNGGIDTLIGGLGADTFMFNAVKDGGGSTKAGATGDIITDFVSGIDKIGILRSGFKIAQGVDLGAGGVFDFATEYFESGTGASTPSGVDATRSGHGQFLFNTDTDQLWWDPDGIGKADAVLLATFNTDIVATDFDLWSQNIKGDATDNTFVAAQRSEAFFGLDGSDTVSYADGTGAVVASLASPVTNAGYAAGDTYVGIENLVGTAFNDKLTGNKFDNLLEGGSGADRLNGGAGVDTASYANAAAAGVTASLLNAKVNTGEAAGDTYVSIENLLGSAFEDTLIGSNGVNVLNGGAGDDRLIGNGRIDTLTGGLGADTFQFNAINDGGGATKASVKATGDLIMDFEVGVDKVGILRSAFGIDSGVDFGLFATDYFVSGAGAANSSGVLATRDGHGQFLFNTDTNQLWWDADGNGKKMAVLLATFQNGAHVQATDFDLL
jgi:Ca2+-binding RTX toxin-like protein